MAFVLQRASRQYIREAQVRTTTPQFIYNHLLPHAGAPEDELNPDPAGTGIVAGQLANVVPIALGATALVMTSIVGMGSSVISAYQLPIGTDPCEAYLWQNLAKATLPMDLAGYTAFYAADYWRPNCTISSFETLTCLSDPLFVNAAVQGHFTGLLNIGLIAPQVRTWQQCIAAYSNYVTFLPSMAPCIFAHACFRLFS